MENTSGNAARKATELFLGGMNCAEAVLTGTLLSWGIDTPIAPRIATAFGGGLGQMRSTCGALSGALMLAGLLRGREAGGSDKNAHELARKLMSAVQAEFGSYSCGDMTGIIPLDAQSQKNFRETGGRERICNPAISLLCNTIEQEAENAEIDALNKMFVVD